MKLSGMGIVALVHLTIALVPCHSGFAQFDRQGLSISPQAGTANFRFAEPNELTIVVSIIGAIKNPGRYELSRSINLLDAISLAGGWSEGSDASDIVVTRMAGTGEGAERKELHFDLEDLTQLKSSQLGLQQGDIIFVPSSSSVTFDDVLRYATALGVLITTAIAITN